jgi:hypothetical protein
LAFRDIEADEDSLDREDAPAAVSGMAGAFPPGKRGRGRPKGTPKTGGRVKEDVSDAEIQRTLRVATPRIIERMVLIASGSDVWHSGTTGKACSKPATLREQLRAAELVLAKVLGDKSTGESTSTNTNVTVEPSVEEAESLRRALLDDLMMKSRTAAVEVEGAGHAGMGVNAARQAGRQAESRFLTSSSDNIPSDDTPSNSVTVTESGITSITDPRQIAAFDARLAAERASLESSTSSDDNPRPGSRIELGEGYFAILDKRSTGEPAWYCFSPDISAGHSAIKPNPDACRKWFFENTSVGQAVAKGLRIIK